MTPERRDSIIYQSQIYYRDLINTLVAKQRKGKALDSKWDKARLILSYLKALNYIDRLTDEDDITNVDYILQCLIKLCELNQYPISSPLAFVSAPAVIVGEKGDTGDRGADGATGPTGLATDFQALGLTFSVAVDDFLVTDAYACRWDYVVTEAGGASRSGTILAVWNSSGSLIDFNDSSTPDIVAPTTGIEFDVQYSSGSIFLIAVVTSGTWNVRGSRYFIPNNGNGTGPISGILPNGYVYIGNAADAAQPQLLSGAITVNPSGVTTLANGAVSNVHIANLAAIAVNKLAALTISRIVVSDASGFLTTVASPTLTELAYVGGVTSAIQTQINTKMADPMTNIGDIIIRNGANTTVRLGIGSASQVLTVVGGVPVWQTPASGFADPMTTSGDIIIRNGGTTVRLGIGSASQVLTVSGGIPSWQTPSAGFSNPMTTNGDLITQAAGVPARLGIGTANQHLITSGGAATWATVTAGITNELQKNGGSGVFASSNVYATATGLGVGVAAPSYRLDVQDSTGSPVVGRILNAGAGEVDLLLERTGTVPKSWKLYIPSGSTDVRLYDAADRFTFTTAGLFTATSLQATGLTSGRIPVAGASGLIGDFSTLTFDSSILTTPTLTLSSVPTLDITQDQILVRDSASGEVKRRTAASITAGIATSSTGGWTFVDADFTSKTNITTMSGTGSYMVVGDVVHVFGWITGTISVAATLNCDFIMPLGITSDSLYGGGGDATVAGTGYHIPTVGYQKNWGLRYSGTNKVKAQIITETNVCTFDGSPINMWIHYTYRRLSV